MVSFVGAGQPTGFGETFQRTVQGTAPAAGAVYSHVLDPTYLHRLVSCVFTLVTDGTDGERYVTLELDGGDANAILVDGAAVTVDPSSTQRFSGSMYRGVSEWNVGTDVFFPITPSFMEGGQTFNIQVTNMGAADQLSLIRFRYDLWRTGDVAPPGDGY